MKRRLTRDTRTALFGGTFDPVHLGHLNVGKSVCKLGLVEHVIFVPTGNPPHKQRTGITPIEDRLAMLSQALEEFEYFHISDFEIQETGVSYTVDTARYYAKYFGENLYVLIGMDSLHELNTWHEAKALVTENNFIVYRRPENRLPNKSDLAAYFGTASADKLYRSITNGMVKNIRSRVIRFRLRDGKDITGLVPPNVARYIADKKLYVNKPH